MKTFALLFLSLTLPGSSFCARAAPSGEDGKDSDRTQGRQLVLRGKRPRRVLLRPGHVFTRRAGGLTRVATFCQGDKPIVPLKD